MQIIRLNDCKYVDDVLEIENASFSLPWTRGMLEDEFSKEIATYLGIVDNDRVIAYAGFWTIFDEAHITNIAVSSGYRRQGFAKALIKEMKNLCKKNGITKMTLEVRKSNAPAIALYEKAGFEGVGFRKGYYEDNKEDALIMWVNL